MCQDRAAARQLYWIGTVTSGHHNVAPGSSQERSARGGAAAAVLGRYGGGWVAMGRGGEASGLAVVPTNLSRQLHCWGKLVGVATRRWRYNINGARHGSHSHSSVGAPCRPTHVGWAARLQFVPSQSKSSPGCRQT